MKEQVADYIYFASNKIGFTPPLDAAQNTSAMALFYEYFKKTWQGIYATSDFNVSRYLNDPSMRHLLLQRTNNPVERLNRHMNAAFPSAHPTMPQFITVIKNLCNTYVSDFNNIQTGNREPQVHQDAQVCPIPAGYEILKQATLQAAHVGTVAPVAEAPTDVDTETEDDDDDVPARPVRKKHRADRFDEINF